MDAFDDLANPPSSVITVVQNRWLSNGFKETVSTIMLLVLMLSLFVNHFCGVMVNVLACAENASVV